MKTSKAIIHINARPKTNPNPFTEVAPPDSLPSSQIWLEALEPRLLFTASAASLNLDPGFGHGGVQTNGPAQPISITADGKIYAVDPWASIGPLQSGYEILRFDSNGVPDPTFGNGGAVLVAALDSSRILGLNAANPIVQPDGKIVVAMILGDWPDSRLTFFRFNPDGSPDSTFGTGGQSIIAGVPANISPCIWLQSDGSIAALYPVRDSPVSSTPIILRLTSDGSPDTSFGTDGQRLLGLPIHPVLGGDGSSNVIIESRTRTLPSGETIAYIREYKTVPWAYVFLPYVQIRFDVNDNIVAENTLPTGFGTISIQADGQAIFIDARFSGSKNVTSRLFRLRLDGTLDPLFGDNGVTLPFPAENIQSLSNGQILLSVFDPSADWGYPTAAGLYRLNNDGTPDLTFAGGQPALSTEVPLFEGNVLTLPDGSTVFGGGGYFNPPDVSGGPVLVKILPNGGTPDNYIFGQLPISDTIDDPSSDPLNGAAMVDDPNNSDTSQTAENLFTPAADSTLFNPNGAQTLLT